MWSLDTINTYERKTLIYYCYSTHPFTMEEIKVDIVQIHLPETLSYNSRRVPETLSIHVSQGIYTILQIYED